MENKLTTLFNWQDYIELNKDLHNISSQEDAINHWTNTGYAQMRLCNKRQLHVVNEFGCEIILYISYYYYLHTHNLLFNNKIITYKGMKPFYYFLDSDTLIERAENRVWSHPSNNPLIVNDLEHVKYLDFRFWVPPPYKSIYKNNILIFNKPLLVVHNKHTIEWRIKPENFIDCNTLKYIFDTLKDTYQIVYIRPTNKKIDENYSIDHNLFIDELLDYDMIENDYKNSVLTITDILNQYNYIYNELLLMLYSNCTNYISVQGGTSHFISFFYNKMVLLHKCGRELICGAYDGWYKETNAEEINKQLIVCDSYDEIKNNLNIFL